MAGTRFVMMPIGTPRAFLRCLPAAVLFLLVPSLFAQGALPGQLGKMVDPGAPIYIEAQRVEYSQEDDVYVADGDVVVTQAELRTEADHVTLNMNEQTVTATGHVWITNPEATMVADSVMFHMETQLGVVVTGQMVMTDVDDDVRYYLSGERIEKIGDNRYLIWNGGYSTCDCGAKTPSWRMKGKYMDATVDGYGWIKHALFYWWKIPVFYSPFTFVPIKVTRQTGFLFPDIQFSGRDGFQFDLPFFWELGEHHDATIYTNFIEKRGLKEGIEYRYKLAREFFGEVRADAIQDRRYGNRPGEFRWQLSHVGRWRLFRNLEIRHDVNMVSDREYVIDFDEDLKLKRFDRYLRSTITVNNRWDRYNLNAGTVTFQDLARDDNAFAFQQLPRISFAGMPQPVTDKLPFLVRFDSEVIHFNRQRIEAGEEALNKAVGEDIFLENGTRLALMPEVLAPFNIKHAAVFTPRAGLIETVYYLPHRSNWERMDDPPSGMTTFERVETDVRQWDVRHTYFVGANLSTELQRVFPVRSSLIQGFKHSIEPGLNYYYQAHPTGESDLPVFDGFDRLAPQNVISAYLYNRLWARTFSVKDQKFVNLRMIDFRIIQDFDVDETIRPAAFDEWIAEDGTLEREEIERRPFRDLRFDLRAVAATGFFIDKLLIDGQIDWNLYDLYMSRVNGLIAFSSVRDDKLVAEYRYRTDPDGNKAIQSIVGLAQIVAWKKRLAFQYRTKFTFIEQDFIENVYGVQYWSGQNCWNVLLQYEDKRDPDEQVVRLLFNLIGLAELSGSQGL